jgi:hypothetical protein
VASSSVSVCSGAVEEKATATMVNGVTIPVPSWRSGAVTSRASSTEGGDTSEVCMHDS